MCANGSTQRVYIFRKNATSRTASSESMITIGVIDAKHKIDVMTLDVPNAFLQTEIALDRDKIILKIREQLVDIIIEICPGVCDKYVQYKGGQNILYIPMIKALYGILVSLILYYKKFREDIEGIGFQVNPYDICVANQMKSETNKQ